jgi:hypothetical protein
MSNVNGQYELPVVNYDRKIDMSYYDLLPIEIRDVLKHAYAPMKCENIYAYFLIYGSSKQKIDQIKKMIDKEVGVWYTK